MSLKHSGLAFPSRSIPLSSCGQKNTRDTDWVPSVSLRHMRLIYTNVWIYGWYCHLLVQILCILRGISQTPLSKLLCCPIIKYAFICFGVFTTFWHIHCSLTCWTMHTHTQAPTCLFGISLPLKKSFSSFVNLVTVKDILYQTPQRVQTVSRHPFKRSDL